MDHKTPAPFPREFHVAASVDISHVELAAKKTKRPAKVSAGTAQDKREVADTRATVLLFGHLRELALYRAEVLESRGFRVVTPATKPEVETFIRTGKYDIAVLSYTLPSRIVQEMAELIRQECPECPLLMISQNYSEDPHILPDEIVPAEQGPSALVDAIRRRLRHRIQ